MKAIILSIGDELALGQTVDTNSPWIAQQLAAVGCDVIEHRTVSDDRAYISSAVCQCATNCDTLLISGGLGPTEDDLTREALADAAGVELVTDADALKHLEAFFEHLGRPMPKRNSVQAMLPTGAKMLSNPNGTAPGLRIELRPGTVGKSARAEKDISEEVPVLVAAGDDVTARIASFDSVDRADCGGGSASQTFDEAASAENGSIDVDTLGKGKCCVIFAMPGVPKEMKPMFTDHVLPWIKERADGAVILQTKLNTFGVGESTIAERLGDLMRRGANPSIGTTVSGGVVSIRINARFANRSTATDELNMSVTAVRTALGDIIYGQDEQTLVEAVADLLKSLTPAEQGETGEPRTLAVAESCTGGLLAKMITDVPGSGQIFKQGWVTYSNEAKESLLGVSAETLSEHGAVSEQVASEMAIGARQHADSTFALSITGIAGPEGAVPGKPVGTVCFGLAHPDGVEVRRFIFPGDRDMIRDRSAKMALSLLRYHLLGLPLPR